MSDHEWEEEEEREEEGQPVSDIKPEEEREEEVQSEPEDWEHSYRTPPLPSL